MECVYIFYAMCVGVCVLACVCVCYGESVCADCHDFVVDAVPQTHTFLQGITV